MVREERDISELAGRVSDGLPVDWDTAERDVPTDRRRILIHLRTIAAVAGLHRKVPFERAVPDEHHETRDMPAPSTTVELPRDTSAEPTAARAWGHLEIQREIGAGGFGRVYLAWDRMLQRHVALKLWKVERASSARHVAKRMLAEGRRLARVRHPNVVVLHGAEWYGEEVGIWMEMVQGRTLEDLLRSQGAFGPREAANVGMELCSALAAVHRAGLVHGDVKTGNVMREAGGRILLMDFGAGKELGRALDSERVTGTPYYMAPEILRGDAPTSRSDLFALGVLLFHLLTGSYPFEAVSMESLRSAHERNDRKLLRELRPELPETLARVVETALALAPEDRFASAGQMQEALAAAAGIAATPATVPRRPRRYARIITLGAAAALAAAVALRWAQGPDSIDSLAVLPLVNATGDPESEYLADGITESLINDISRLGNLKVIARASVFRYKEHPPDTRTVAQALGVHAVLTGTMRKIDQDMSISVELIDTRDQSHVWGGRYQASASEFLGTEAEIVREISHALRLNLSEDEAHRLDERRETRGEAYRLYLRGRYAAGKYTRDSAERAIELFEEALRIDPGFALAYAGIADVYYNMSSVYLPPVEAMPRARGAAQRALDTDETLAEAHASRGIVLSQYEWRFAEAEREFRRALELDPGCANTRLLYGLSLLTAGRSADAREQLNRALELDPLSAYVADARTAMLIFARPSQRRYEQALGELRAGILMEPDFHPFYLHLGLVLTAQGRFEEALRALEKATTLDEDAWGLSETGYALARAGREGEALRILSRLQEMSRERYISPCATAALCVGLRRTDEALQWLEIAARDRDEVLPATRWNPYFDDLHDEPRFRALFARLGLVLD